MLPLPGQRGCSKPLPSPLAWVMPGCATLAQPRGHSALEQAHFSPGILQPAWAQLSTNCPRHWAAAL